MYNAQRRRLKTTPGWCRICGGVSGRHHCRAMQGSWRRRSLELHRAAASCACCGSTLHGGACSVSAGASATSVRIINSNSVLVNAANLGQLSCLRRGALPSITDAVISGASRNICFHTASGQCHTAPAIDNVSHGSCSGVWLDPEDVCILH